MGRSTELVNYPFLVQMVAGQARAYEPAVPRSLATAGHIRSLIGDQRSAPSLRYQRHHEQTRLILLILRRHAHTMGAELDHRRFPCMHLALECGNQPPQKPKGGKVTSPINEGKVAAKTQILGFYIISRSYKERRPILSVTLSLEQLCLRSFLSNFFPVNVENVLRPLLSFRKSIQPRVSHRNDKQR